MKQETTINNNSAWAGLVKDSFKCQSMPQNTRKKEELNEEARPAWEQVERMYRKAKKLTNSEAEKDLAEKMVDFLINFIDPKEKQYIATELTSSQVKQMNKLFAEYEKLNSKNRPQIDSEGKMYYYSEPEM